jgi:hypothetical protein
VVPAAAGSRAGWSGRCRQHTDGDSGVQYRDDSCVDDCDDRPHNDHRDNPND